MSEDHVQCIVVGGGPAGSAAAFTLAKSGAEVLVLERGKTPGSKNMFGGILYSNILNSIIPDFWEKAPLERNVTRQKYSLLTDDTELTLFDIHCGRFKQEPFNNSFIVSRRKFDEWFAGQAMEEGADYVTGTRVDKVIKDRQGKVIGIESLGDRLYADVVILADGANSMLAKQCGLRKRFHPGKIGLGIKEWMALPKGKIEDRFNLEGGEGASFKYLGQPVKYAPGGAFIYTNDDSLSVGLIVRLSDIANNGAKPNDLLEGFKNHPYIKKLLEGGELQEYSAHILPEMGYDYLPEISADGILVIGDAAGLVNALFHEGINFAMASGVMAGLTVLEAIRKNDYSNNVLKEYRGKLKESFVLKDMKKVMKFHKLMENNGHFFDNHVKSIVQFATQMISVTNRSKEEQISEAWSDLRTDISLLDAFELWGIIR